MFCTNCGMEFEGKFCPECGEKVVNANAVLEESADDFASRPIQPPTANSVSAPLPMQLPYEFDLETLDYVYPVYKSVGKCFIPLYLSNYFELTYKQAKEVVRTYDLIRPKKEKLKFNVFESRKRELIANGWYPDVDADKAERAAKRAERQIPKCPKCGSVHVQMEGRSFSMGKAVAGTVLLGGFGVFMGSGGGKKIEMVCTSCGKTWTIRSKR